MFDLTLEQREQLKLVKVGDRVAIVARSGRVYVGTVASVIDDRIIVPRGDYHIHRAVSRSILWRHVARIGRRRRS